MNNLSEQGERKPVGVVSAPKLATATSGQNPEAWEQFLGPVAPEADV